MTARHGLLSCFFALLLGACGATATADRETTLPKADHPALQRGADADRLYEAERARGDALFEKRDDRQQLEAAIAAYQSAARVDPRRPDAWLRLARAAFLLAEGHLVASEDPGQVALRRHMHERGVLYAKRALMAQSEAFRRAIAEGRRTDRALETLERTAVPGLYWYAVNYSKWAAAKGVTTLLKYKDRIKKVMDRVLELDPAYFHGAPHRYFGAYFAKVPHYAGGDLKKSKAHFEEALAQAPGFFETKLLMAEFYAAKKKDRELFDSLLREVIEGDVAAQGDVVPENRLTQRAARRLQARADQLF